MDGGFFGGLFDFDGNGKLDSFERMADFMAFNDLMNETEKAEREDTGLDFEDDDF